MTGEATVPARERRRQAAMANALNVAMARGLAVVALDAEGRHLASGRVSMKDRTTDPISYRIGGTWAGVDRVRKLREA